jgi:hypothetical protein
MDENNVIRFVKGTTVNLSFDFDEDISSYTSANFGIAKSYDDTPIIDLDLSIEDNAVNVELTPEQTDLFTEFLNGKNSAQYKWWLDVIDSVNNVRVNVFPQTGEPAPLCIVYKHV